MAPSFTYDVFLSHNKADKPRVRRLAERLRKAGVRVWLDDWVLKPGDDIYLAIERGLESSRTLVLCLSPAALGSDWVGLERSTVLFRDPSNVGRRFIPLLLADCDLPDTLRRYKHVDFRQEVEAAFEELLTACRSKKELAHPGPQPEIKKKPEEPEPLAVLERKLKGHTLVVWSVAVSPDETWAVSGSANRTVKIWDLETGECLATLEGHKGDVRCVAITPDGKRILSGSHDNSIRVWAAQDGQPLATWQASTHWVTSLAPLSDGRRVISSGAGDDPTLRLWDIDTTKCIAVLKGHIYAVTSIALARDETRVVSGSYDKTLKLWNLATGECLAILKGHTEKLNSAQITPDGRHAVSGSDDKTIKVWDLKWRTCVGTLEGHQGQVHSVAISPEGTLIASTGFWDRTVRLWDWKSRSCLQVIRHEESPVSVAFSPDGSRLVVGTGHGPIFIYRPTGGNRFPRHKA